VGEGFAPDLYPRQRTGLVVVLTGCAIAFVAFLFGHEPPRGSVGWTMLVFYIGLGCGMLSGNTRTLRVPGNRRRR
jgi:hypothetical protein